MKSFFGSLSLFGFLSYLMKIVRLVVSSITLYQSIL